jgi:kynurenine formamidase
MFQAAFDYSYTALTPDGARWLVEHTNVKLIGIDYLSIATYETCKEGHVILFHKVCGDAMGTQG